MEAVGDRVEILLGAVVALPASDFVRDALLTATVTHRSAGRSAVELTFRVDDPLVEWPELLAGGFVAPGTRLILVAIRPGPSVLFDGMVTGHEIAISRTAGASTLVVGGEDLSLFMDLQPSASNRPDLPAVAQVAVILAKYAALGVVPDVRPPPIGEFPALSDPLLDRATTDYGRLHALAAECGHVFRLEPGPLPGQSVAYWGPEIRDVRRPPPIVVVDHIVDRLLFQLDGLLRREISVTIVPAPGISIPVPVPDLSVVRPQLAARPAPKLREEVLPNTAHLSAVQAAAAGLRAALATADALSARGALDTDRYGEYLPIGAVVEITGTGVAYDGLYYVNEVTHRITSNGHGQDFHLRREGLGAPPEPPP